MLTTHTSRMALNYLCQVFILSGLVYTGLADSCARRCSQRVSSAYSCQCNNACETFRDCCSDYVLRCRPGLHQEDPLSFVMQRLWNNDVNRLPDNAYTISTSGSKYFTSVTEDMMGSTFQLFIALLDNYIRTARRSETRTSAELAEENAFLDAILTTDVMQIAETFLISSGTISDSNAFRYKLQELWFELYPRSAGGLIDSSGFEHVFVGERKSNIVSGFHSWVQFYLEEKAGNLLFNRQISSAKPCIRSLSFNWYGGRKSMGSFFLGTSPEYELAVYTICALQHRNRRCNFMLNGSNVSIRTYDVTRKAGDQIASAYPSIYNASRS